MPLVAGLTKVLVVNDSVFMRTMIKTALSKEEDLEVVGVAQNGAEATLEALDKGAMDYVPKPLNRHR